MDQFDPELTLEHTDRAHLVAVSTMEGYKVIHRICRAEVDKFIVASINANDANEKEVIAAHRLAKAAAQVYQGITNRINSEIALYIHSSHTDDKPVDATEGLLDLGELADQLPEISLPGGGE